jgi:hypothetical protein
MFSQTVGRLLVQYSCLSVLMARCHDANCERNERSTLAFSYFFPTWLLARRILVRLAYSSANGPELLLRLPRVVPPTSDVFNFARTGNVRGLQHLFENGLASPFDVNSCGLTPLHVSSDL